MLGAIPSLERSSAKRVTPTKPSRMISKLQRSPTTSRVLAIEQFISSKLVRLTDLGHSLNDTTQSASASPDNWHVGAYEVSSRRRAREACRLTRLPQICVLHQTR